MNRTNCPLIAVLLASLVIFACGGEEEAPEQEAFHFIVYPGARYLGELTQATLRASRIITPAVEPPPTAIYDTEAPIEQVVAFYAKEYGFAEVPPDTPAGQPGAYHWRTGDLQTDNKPIEDLLKKMNMPTDVSKAVGSYRAVDLPARPSLPRVIIQRPYFDSITSQVVDRTMILMSP